MLKKKQAVVGGVYALVVAAGGIASALGLAVMVAWYTHNMGLIQVLPAAPPMRYNTALAFLLSGLTILALGHRQQRLAKVLSLVVAAIGLLTLSQYIFDINLGIDELLMQDYVTHRLYSPRGKLAPGISLPVKQFLLIVNKPLPGRPSPTTALGFALLGTALGFVERAMQRSKASLIAGLLTTVVAALSFVAFIGHLSGLVTAYDWGQTTGVAIHSAFGLLVLSTGTIALALYSGSSVPRWLPLLIGFGILTTNLFLWQVLKAQEERFEIELMSVASGRSPILQATAIVLTLTAFLISLVVYFAQTAQSRARKLEQINEQLAIEISQRSRAELALSQANDLLEARVQERTTALLQANVALQESYSILRAVIEGTTDSIFIKDLKGRYLLINSAGANVVGKPLEDILGKNDLELFHRDIALSIIENDRQVIASEENQTYEDIIPFRDELRTFLAAKTVLRNQQGKVTAVIGIARDISDRILAEQQIKQLNEDLERRVIERTTQLEAANKELEAFSYSVSHDLRAPLRSIDGFSQALLERYTSELDDKGKHYLQRVRAASQRMGELIDDLLKLSRVSKSQMQRQTVDLTAMVEAIAIELQQTQPERNVEFVIASSLVAQGDARLLRVVLDNLLNNAWKFTSKSVDARIEFGSISQPDGITAYFVRDNGAGFDMAYANKLFGAFQRLHTTGEFPGTGIGLATVQRIIDRHGGRVWAEGALDLGATFYFTI